MSAMREAIAQIKERTDLARLIGEVVALSPSGSGYKGLCPFHSERTPSFHINPQRGLYHCYGCGVGGSSLDFLMAYRKLDFMEAVDILAAQVGVSLPRTSRGQTTERIPEALILARDWYHNVLLHRPEAEPARQYLRERGFGEAEWETFHLGYAPPGWQNFLNHARAQGFSTEALLHAGLIRRSEGGRFYDLLRERIIFPIHAPGRQSTTVSVIAFGGRLIQDAQGPKYLNTPESSLYRKGETLYGLDRAQEAIHRHGESLIAEGYLDLIRLHTHGFQNAVATCGTALSAEHLRRLARYAPRVLFLFDGDSAGERAALRAAPLALAQGITARVAQLPSGKDPDTLLREAGPTALNTCLEQAEPLLEHVTLTTLRREGHSLEGRQRAVETLVPLLARVQASAGRDLALRHIADLLEVPVETIFAQMRSATVHDRTSAQPAPSAPVSHTETPQRMLLALILRHPSEIAFLRSEMQTEAWEDPALEDLYKRLGSLPEQAFSPWQPETLLEQWPEHAPLLRELLAREPLHLQALTDPHHALLGHLKRIKTRQAQRLFARLRRAHAESIDETPLRDAWNHLHKEIAHLPQRNTFSPRPELRLRHRA